MKWIVAENYGELSELAAEMVVGEMLTKQKRVNLAITAGTTPIGMYERLTTKVKGKNYLDHVHYYNFDEIPYKSGKQEGITLSDLRRLYFSPAAIAEEQIEILNEKNYQQHDAKIASDGGLDAIVLGIGTDGHYCGNLPGTTRFTDFTTEVPCDERLKKIIVGHFEDPAENPDSYVTLGPRSVMAAKHIILLASGVKKSEAMQRFYHGKVTEAFPASILKMHPNITVIVDKAAGKLI